MVTLISVKMDFKLKKHQVVERETVYEDITDLFRRCRSALWLDRWGTP